MLNWIDAMMLKARLSCSNFMNDFKNDERGLSGVVVAVLLILVAVLAVILLWDLLGDYIDKMWENITTTDDALKTFEG